MLSGSPPPHSTVKFPKLIKNRTGREKTFDIFKWSTIDGNTQKKGERERAETEVDGSKLMPSSIVQGQIKSNPFHCQLNGFVFLLWRKNRPTSRPHTVDFNKIVVPELENVALLFILMVLIYYRKLLQILNLLQFVMIQNTDVLSIIKSFKWP